MKKKIIFSTGGTGGHILPAVNLMKHFYKREYDVLLVTDKRGFNFIENNFKVKSYILKAETLTNKLFFKKILSFFIIFFSIIKSIIILHKEKPNLVFGFGGYVSFPICFVTKFFKIPLIIYENNMVLGRTNKFLSSFSEKIFVAREIDINFPKKYKNKTQEVGYILSKDIIDYSNNNKRVNKKNLSILVLGGSQGAKIFGKIIPPTFKKLIDNGYNVEINQQCIKEQKSIIEDFYKKNNIKNYVFEFHNNILELLSLSDLAITRCGASTTAELNHTITPFIAVPLKNSIDNHQYLNARYYEKKGCCLVLEENNFNIENLYNLILKIIKNKNTLENIRKNMKNNNNNNVYSIIENEIIKFI